MKKYELTNETITIDNGKTLHRIRALIDIEAIGVKIGDFGGYIEKEENLSHCGNAWVSGVARVYDNAVVGGNTMVYDNAEVHGDAWICDDARVCRNAVVYGNAVVGGNTMIVGDSEVYDDAWICGYAVIGGVASVYGNAVVGGNTMIVGDAEINKSAHALTIGPIGIRNGTITFFRTKENIIKVKCGCFYGTIDKFLAKVELTHGNNKQGQAYRIAAELAKVQIDLE